jgi:hypothetical protein
MINAMNHFAMTKSPFTNKPQSLFVTGGSISGYSNGVLSSAEILTNNGWEVFSPSLPVTVYLHCMVLLNSTTAMVVGGIQNGAVSAKTYLIGDNKKIKIELFSVIKNSLIEKEVMK